MTLFPYLNSIKYFESAISSMDQRCDKCGRSVEGLVKVAEPEDAYNYYKHWCFACVYEKGLADYNERNIK